MLLLLSYTVTWSTDLLARNMALVSFAKTNRSSAGDNAIRLSDSVQSAGEDL